MSQASDAYHTPAQPAGQKSEDTFLVRIVSLDYYMAKPLPGFDICFSQSEGTSIDRVPVVQIYGSTPGGQKTCVHLHKVCPTSAYATPDRRALITSGLKPLKMRVTQAFPYFYVPYDNDFPTDPVQGDNRSSMPGDIAFWYLAELLSAPLTDSVGLSQSVQCTKRFSRCPYLRSK